ncbi:AAA family ATPase [Pseudoduganella danionis]|uniref:AAA family ATPase n=1 Tax=Pseudoduganella danionis TaxID=1890295 RepID=UPI0035B2D6A2
MKAPHPASHSAPMLHLVCGKIAAGKSTLTAQLASAPGTVLLSEDRLLSTLYPDEIRTLTDYVRCAGRLHDAMAGVIVAMLAAGSSVVLDFPANTPAARAWMRSLIDHAGCQNALHYLDVSDQECKLRLRRRNDEGLHPYNTSEAEFDLITSYFVPPAEEEGFHVLRHTAS